MKTMPAWNLMQMSKKHHYVGIGRTRICRRVWAPNEGDDLTNEGNDLTNDSGDDLTNEGDEMT